MKNEPLKRQRLSSAFCDILEKTTEVSPMDKLTMEDLGYFLYMQEMERQQQAEQEAEEAEGPEDDDGDE